MTHKEWDFAEDLKKAGKAPSKYNFFQAVRELEELNNKGRDSVQVKLILKLFIRNVTVFCLKLPKNIVNLKHMEQLVDQSISINANCIGADKSSDKEDFVRKIKACREKARECACCLESIVDINPEEFKKEGLLLKRNAEKFNKIFSQILNRS